MNKIWYHVYNRKEYPPVSYGFATDENGIVVTANEKVSWMVGKHIDAIKKFFEDKPVDLNPVIPKKEETDGTNGTDDKAGS
jgi:hypothetical protein